MIKMVVEDWGFNEVFGLKDTGLVNSSWLGGS